MSGKPSDRDGMEKITIHPEDLSKVVVDWNLGCDLPPSPVCQAGPTAEPIAPANRPRRLAIWGLAVLGCAALLAVMIVAGATLWHQTHRSPTLEYWMDVGRIVKELSRSTQGKSADHVVSILRGTAEEIESIPTQGVDVEAVECCLKVSGAMRLVADRTEKLDDPMMLVISFLRGLTSDPFGTLFEEQSLTADVMNEWRSAQRACVHTRATLTARHGVEFPPLEF